MSIHSDRCPLLTPQGQRLLKRLQEHPDAPHFNYATGDRLHLEDLPAIERFREQLRERRPCTPHPPPDILVRIAMLREQAPFFRDRIPAGLDLERDWSALPTTSRLDLALAPWDFVPDAEPLDRLIIYRTAGTTGIQSWCRIIRWQSAVRAAHRICPGTAQRQANVRRRFCRLFLVGPRYALTPMPRSSITGSCAASPRSTAPDRMAAGGVSALFHGDAAILERRPDLVCRNAAARPASESQRSGLDAGRHEPGLKRRLTGAYQAPVIDWYSLVETGPIGYACPLGHGYQLPTDLFVEVVRSHGTPAAPASAAEIAVTGGRNQFAPLLRYRTGDFGLMDFSACPCGDPLSRLLELEGRVPVLIRRRRDACQHRRSVPACCENFLLLHEFVQHTDPRAS